ncbi:MAG TPA: molybdenum cofactor biosynthesis protein MoaE [Verrucomicrobiae bacterium]|nr:molybdenum cofactor biosynthesis protein MoaE [Verrucomicrobiae bacterium]
MSDPPAPVTVLLFAGLRVAAGIDRIAVAPSEAEDVAACWDRCCQLAPGLAAAEAARATLRVARNRELVGWDAAVHPGDELAFLPPVSGGAPGSAQPPPPAIQVGPEPIDVARLAASLPTRAVGARVTFVGIVRDPDQGRPVPHLDYEAYQEMAVAELGRIAQAACSRFGALAVAVHHRTGRVRAGEPSVAVVAVAPHRQAAFDACSHVIDTLKATAPIWKGPDPTTGPC